MCLVAMWIFFDGSRQGDKCPGSNISLPSIIVPSSLKPPLGSVLELGNRNGA